MNNRVTSRSFARISSMIRRIIRLSKFVDRFLQKPFGFFPRIFSISGLIRLRSRALETFAAIVKRVMPL